ncbi:MAG: UTP--glucose-1-phosphate uridylyltransferase [Anaeromyxobacteraceae bacterium]
MDEAILGGSLEAPEREAFERVLRKLRRGELGGRPPGVEEPLRPGDVEPWPLEGGPRWAELEATGEEALRRGEVGSLVVAGGAGTRFGAAVKALVPVLGDRTFVALKLEDARRAGDAAGRPAPVAIMTSASTQEAVDAEVAGAEEVLVFRQRSLPRLTRALELWLDAGGRPSLAPAGHGDVFRALRDSGVGEALRARGVRTLLFSNVDNLAATLDPVPLGAHLALGAALTVEVTARRSPAGALDAGAAPVRLGGRVRLVEQVEPAGHPLISTNNLWLDLDRVLAGPVELPWRVVEKTVEGQEVLQLEQVAGEITAVDGPDGRPALPAAYLEVPREPPAASRFEPVKRREDLPAVAARLRERLTG